MGAVEQTWVGFKPMWDLVGSGRSWWVQTQVEMRRWAQLPCHTHAGLEVAGLTIDANYVVLSCFLKG